MKQEILIIKLNFDLFLANLFITDVIISINKSKVYYAN